MLKALVGAPENIGTGQTPATTYVGKKKHSVKPRRKTGLMKLSSPLIVFLHELDKIITVIKKINAFIHTIIRY